MNKSHQIVVETPKVITKKSKNGKTKVGEVEVFIMGKSYKVPAGLTIMKAVEFAGYRFIRGCGCRAGFCGACSTVYRIEDEQKLGFDLACQKVVEDKMYLAQLPFVPALKAEYDIEKLEPSDTTLITMYPEIARCVSCNTCTKSCPQDIEVMKYIQSAIRGDIAKCAEAHSREGHEPAEAGLANVRHRLQPVASPATPAPSQPTEPPSPRRTPAAPPDPAQN